MNDDFYRDMAEALVSSNYRSAVNLPVVSQPYLPAVTNNYDADIARIKGETACTLARIHADSALNMAMISAARDAVVAQITTRPSDHHRVSVKQNGWFGKGFSISVDSW